MLGRPSIGVLITSLVLLPLLVVAALLVWLSAATTRRIAEDLGAQITRSATASVRAELEHYLSSAVRTSDQYARRVERGELAVSGLDRWKGAMLDDLAANPDVASICFANPEGDAVWLLRAHGRLEFGLADGKRQGHAVEYAVAPGSGEQDAEPLRTYQYDPRSRPWYQAAMQSHEPIWTPVYFWFGEAGAEAETGTGYTREVRSADGRLLGVLVIDVTLGSLSQFLKSLPLAESGAAFVVDDQDLLVAASQAQVNSNDGRRLSLAESSSFAAQAAWNALNERADLVGRTFPSASSDPQRGALDQGGSIAVDVEGEPSRLTVAALTPFRGIDWRLITIVRERDFLSRVAALRTRSMALAAAAVLVSIALAVWLSRQLTAPLVTLSAHVRRVAGGDFSSRVDLRAAKELEELSREMNDMAAGLKQRMELERAMGLAMEVQKCLLPRESPHVPRLDVASRSQYCDATGGDYYDFLDVKPTSKSGILVAVGDVTGHGIASALIMASARAALRAHAFEGENLASLLTKVNRVFSADSDHGRFMTLALLAIDGESRSARWASAGHDPAVAYEPSSDTFFELEGGSVPLGVIDDHEYEQYEQSALSPGTILILATDGVWETHNTAGAQYGKDRMRDVLRRTATRSSREIADSLEADIAAFRGAASVLDDITFVVIRLVNDD